MPKVNLSGMTVEALMDLRKEVDETLLNRRADIERQLARMDGGARVKKSLFDFFDPAPSTTTSIAPITANLNI